MTTSNLSATEDLREIELFSTCAAEDLERLAELLGPAETVAAGSALCEEGADADRWWVVLDGEADATVAGRFVGAIGPGESVGEMGVLDGAPRVATVTARTDMVVRAVPGDRFESLLLASPQLTTALLRLAARRLREADGRHLGSSVEPVRTTTEAPVVGPGDGAVEWNPLAPGYFDDPYPQYAALREDAPVYMSELTGSWVVSRYDDVLPLLRDRKLSHDIANAAASPSIDAERERFAATAPRFSRSMLRLDAPDHTRLRKLVSRAFTPRAVREWNMKIGAIVDEILSELAERDDFDLIADYAFPLPSRIISDLLGMPAEDIPALRSWSHAITKTLDPINTPDDELAAAEAGAAMDDYVQEVIARKRRSPEDDLLSALIAVEEEGDRLSERELLDTTLLLYIAGHETTVNLIGNGVSALFDHPGELRRLRNDPTLDANATEELLRYDSPVQFARRFATEAFDVAGTTIPQGATVVLATAGANRDPRHWGPTADVVDVAREGANQHASFGGGPHHCVGASLARLEGQIAIGRLLRRMPELAPASEERNWEPRIILRALSKLPVRPRG